MTSAEGEFIGRGWRIGPILGSGACGFVHELTAPPGGAKNNAAWAVKVAPLSKSSAASSKGKKRKKTLEQINADLILHEYITLQNAGKIRGKLVPEISFMGDPPAYGETEDKSEYLSRHPFSVQCVFSIFTILTMLPVPLLYSLEFRFLVMERMQAPLSEVIPILLDSSQQPNSKLKIPMGQVAIAMLNCIQAMHENGNLFIDVKPENFMLSKTSAAASSKRNTSDVSQRVRLIDFGLVERFGNMAACKHREDAYPNAPLVGTPTYASLNIMSGHTASLRDDVEALGYVICELILMMNSTGTSSSGSGVGKNKKKDVYLPWSDANSDAALFRIKSQEMDRSKRSKSTLFSRLKSAGADTVMDNYFSAVTGLAYSEKPDYDSLRRHLEKLVVAVGSSCKTAETKTTKKRTTKSPARKANASSDVHITLDDDDDSVADSMNAFIDENTENCKPPADKRLKRAVAKENTKVRNPTGTLKAPTTRDAGTQAGEIDDDMDWDPLEAATRTESISKAKLVLLGGPHEGGVIPFGGDHPVTVIVGRNPESRAMKDAIKLALSDDTNVSPVHVKFVLSSKSTVLSVRVTDMSSSSGTVINGTSLPSGKSKQAFAGDEIKIGGTTIQIRKA